MFLVVPAHLDSPRQRAVKQLLLLLLNVQEDSLRQSESKMKELEEERSRLQRTNAAQHTQLDKYKKISEEKQSLADSLETQVTTLKKVQFHLLLFLLLLHMLPPFCLIGLLLIANS